MAEDAEDAYDIDEDFFEALTLLHSTEDDSAEKLRKTLDAFIERKHGFDRTLIARMPKRFLQSSKARGKSFPNDEAASRDDPSRKRVNASRRAENLFAINATKDNRTTVNSFRNESEDCGERGDIPTISIPDEGSADGLLCKVCNGAKLGPLILLECQECQEVYHPLCHQPPVVDVDVYDPRIVWHCGKCADATSVNASSIAFDGRKPKRFRPRETLAKPDESERIDANVSRTETIRRPSMGERTTFNVYARYAVSF